MCRVGTKNTDSGTNALPGALQKAVRLGEKVCNPLSLRKRADKSVGFCGELVCGVWNNQLLKGLWALITDEGWRNVSCVGDEMKGYVFSFIGCGYSAIVTGNYPMDCSMIATELLLSKNNRQAHK